MKNKCICSLYSICILLILIPIYSVAVQKGADTNETFVTAKYNGMSLSEVLQGIKVQTGYNFVIPEDWMALTIFGEFAHVPLEKFFRRILKNRSYTLLIDEEEKIITGREFGNYSKYMYIADPSGIDKKLDPSSGLLVKDLRALHARQLKELQFRKVNPEYVDPISRMPLDELERLHKKQLADVKNDASAIDPLSGLLLDELERLHEKQLADVRDDVGAIYPLSGLPLDELERLHEKQLAGVKDDIGFVPPTPIVRSR